MAVDPDSLAVAPSPMPRPPNVIGTTHVITRTTSIIRPVANLDCNGARVSGISWAVARPVTAVIWSVSRISSISPFTSGCTERGADQNQYQWWPSHFSFCPTLRGNYLRMINKVCLHTLHYTDYEQLSRLSLSKQHQRESKKRLTANRLHNALVEHGISDLYESCDVRANYEVARLSVIFRSFPGVFEDGRHDVAQP